MYGTIKIMEEFAKNSTAGEKDMRALARYFMHMKIVRRRLG